MKLKSIFALSVAGLSFAAAADVMDRPTGIKIGDRLTLRPYVGLSYTYDSNIHSTHGKAKGTGRTSRMDSSIYRVNPNLDLSYLGDNWSTVGGIWYKYNSYTRDPSHNNSSSYGERLKFDWSDSKVDEAGWRFLATEKFEKISQADEIGSGGRGVGCDRHEFITDGALERRLNQYWHLATIASYYLLDYDNEPGNYNRSMYGWKRATIGGEGGYAPSPWTDFILHANYQWYWQDNGANIARVGRSSRGYTLMGGIATHATEKITYRLLGGWSRFEYGHVDDNVDGFTYQGSANWQVNQTLHFMALAASYYQPSEYEAGTANRVDSLSFGVGKSFIRGKVSTTADISYRHDQREYSVGNAHEYTQQYWTARFGLNYVINRFVTGFTNFEYQDCMAHGRTAAPGHNWNYDRFRFTVGVRLTY